MKKILSIVLLSLALSSVAAASPRAIGARLGGDAEVSYQHSVGKHFIEGDLGFTIGRNGGLRFSGVFDFVVANAGDFGFYVGPGLQLGLYDNNFGIGVGGQVGAEYNFKIPLSLSLDWRPMWNFIGNNVSWTSVALGVRYKF